MNRLSLDLGIERKDFLVLMKRWRYLFVGKCDGDVIIKLDRTSASELDPTEFDKLTETEEVKRMYITNTVQTGKVFNIYFEEEAVTGTRAKVRGVN